MALDVDAQFREAALPGAPLDLDFSNDGKLLACANLIDKDGGAAIHVVRTDDGSVTARFMQLNVRRGRGVAFVRGGRELVFLFQRADDATQLYRVAIDSKSPDQLKSYASSVHNHAIVRDLGARRFAVLGNQVEIWDAEADRLLHTLPGADRDERVHAAFSRDGERLYVYGTVEQAVVCYEVASGKETSRWPAPTRFGAQVLVTPDERFLVIAGDSYTGLFIHDLVTGQQVTHDKDDIHTFNADSSWRPWTVAHDSSLLACFRSTMNCFRLPELEDVTVRKSLIDPKLTTDAAAFAWEAPVIGFGTRQDARLRWFPLVPAGAGA